MDKKKTNTNKTVRLSGVTEYHPDKPVMFDPPKLMYVWDDDDAAKCYVTVAKVVYVNPNMVCKGVLAHGDGQVARNMGASWDHCAFMDTQPKDNSDPAYRSYHNTPKAVWDYIAEAKDKGDHTSNDEIVTYRELAQWLADGRGQVLLCKKWDSVVFPKYATSISYNARLDDAQVPWTRTAHGDEVYFMVRKFGDNEPSHPTYKYMGLAAESVPDTMQAPEVKMATLSNVVNWLMERFRPLGYTIAYGDSEVIIDEKSDLSGRRVRLTTVLCELLPKVADESAKLAANAYVPDEANEGLLVFNPGMTLESYIKLMDSLNYIEMLIVRLSGVDIEHPENCKFPVEIADALCRAYPSLREHYAELLRTPDWNDYTK